MSCPTPKFRHYLAGGGLDIGAGRPMMGLKLNQRLPVKTNLLFCAVVLGLLPVRNAVAQSLSLVPPIVIQVNEIDTFHLLAFAQTKKAMDGAWLVIPFKDFQESKVEALVQNSFLLNRSVWIMDGVRIIAEQPLLNNVFSYNRVSGRNECRLALRFTSLAEAQAMAKRLYFQPGLEALIQHFKAGLDDQRSWICPTVVSG